MGTYNYLVIPSWKIKICTKSDLYHPHTDGDLLGLLNHRHYVDLEDTEVRGEVFRSKCISNQSLLNPLTDLHPDKIFQAWLFYHDIDYYVCTEHDTDKLVNTEDYQEFPITEELVAIDPKLEHNPLIDNATRGQIKFQCYHQNLKQIRIMQSQLKVQERNINKKLNMCFGLGDPVWVYSDTSSNSCDSGTIISRKNDFIEVKLENNEDEIIKTTWDKLQWRK
jgi:hypothetical protein